MIRQRSTVKPVSIPAPVGGWNARDGLAAMDEKDAVYLVNWFPLPSSVMVRRGYIKFSTGYPGPVMSVMAYNGASGQKLFAASGSGIYQADLGGAVGAAAYSGLTSVQMQHVNMSTPAGTFLMCVNGVDAGVIYNGSTWSTMSVTGFNTANASNIWVAKQRVWFIEKASLRAWYLPVASIAGAASSIDLSQFCKRGGYLVAMTSWTVSGGFGMSDNVVFVTSEGELLVYQGTDPSTASAWSLVGIYQMGSPMGLKCMAKAGKDVLLISKDGLVSMTQGTFFADTSANKSSITNKIQYAISQVTTTYSANYGWQVQPFPLENMLLLNVPVGAGQQQQYVMNTITGAWCSFTGWHANAWELYKDQIYFGGENYVGLAWYGNDDAGSAIPFDGKQAFNYFGRQGVLKRFTMMRPIISATGTPAIYANVNVDFDDSQFQTTLTYSGTASATWDFAKWDVAAWPGSYSISKQWQGVNGVGYCAAPRLIGQSKYIDIQWMSTDLVMQGGAVL